MNIVQKVKLFDGTLSPREVWPRVAIFLALFFTAVGYAWGGDMRLAGVWSYLSALEIGSLVNADWKNIMMKAVICNDKRLDLLEGKK